MILSVAMCTYNGELYIKEQLESIINQTLPVNEIIICDDGSIDNTINIIKDIVNNTPQIDFKIYQNSNNLGVVKNFEKAISHCRGDIIFFSDQDDIWLPQKTNTIINYLKLHPNIELIFTNALLIDINGEVFTQCTLFEAVGLNKKYLSYWKNGFEFEITNSCNNKITGATIAIRKSLKERTLPLYNNIKILHDEQFASSAIVNKSIRFINECLIKYRLHDKNTCGLNLKWIKTENPQSIAKHYGSFLTPKPINKSFTLFKNTLINDRIKFQEQRYYSTLTFKKRIKIIFELNKYIKYYSNKFLYFYFTDLFFGILPYIKWKIINLWNRH